MKNTVETAKWTKRYKTALHRYLKTDSHASLKPALKLGKDAVALDLDTLSLARIHKKALTALESAENSAETRKCSVGQAQRFFAETVVPIEKTHCASLKAAARVQRMKKTLQRRKTESAASTLLLEQSVIKRQKAEATLDISGKNHRQLIKESKFLQDRLREKTCEILTMQENKKKKISLELQNEVAQTLLAIDLRLLALNTSVEANTHKISKELDDTQQMVRESLTKIDGMNL